MPDINFSRSFNSSGNVVYGTADRSAVGNKALMNNFEKTFLSSMVFNDIFGVPYGGNSLNFLGASYNPGDIDTVVALCAIAVDMTVKSMKSDVLNTTRPNTEKIKSASLLSVSITDANGILISINVVPIEKQSDTTLSLLF